MSRASSTGRVAHLSTLHPPRDNRIFNKECSSLAREGIDLWFIGAQDGDGVDQGVRIVGIGKARGVFQRLVTAQLKAWRALRRVRPDVVHVHDPELIPMVWLWKTLHRKAAIYDAHEDLVGQMGRAGGMQETGAGNAGHCERLLQGWGRGWRWDKTETGYSAPRAHGMRARYDCTT